MTYNLADFGKFTLGLRLEGGAPFVLEPFQRQLLRDHFSTAVEEVVIIPKKNYKTTTLAALALFHLHETPQPDVPILASSSKQAGIMFRQAEKMVRNSGTPVEGTGYRQTTLKDVYDLQGVRYEIRSGLREIRANGGLLYVVAADTDRLDGVIPSLALVDELHRHKTDENYGILSDGLGPRQGRMVTISTAGTSEASPLGELRRRAHEYAVTRKGRHGRYSSGSFVLHEWALDPDVDDPDNLKHVKWANPAKTQTLAELARRKALPSMRTGRWLRFACGIWTAGDDPEITAAEWDALATDIGGISDGDSVVLAPSVGHSAVIGIASMRPDKKVAVRAEHLPGQAGSSILARTEDAIVALCDRYRVEQVLDPGYGMQRSMELVRARGVPVNEHPYSPARQIAASGTFDRFLQAKDLVHDGDPETRAHVLAAVKKSGVYGEHYIAGDETRAITALAMAVHAVSAFQPEPFIGLPSEVLA
jgi:hypothetical protein